MDDKESAPGDSLAFLSVNRAPGKRAIRVVNREELAVSIGALITGDDDEDDDDDFCANQEDDETGSERDSEENSGDGSGDSSSDSNESGDEEEEPKENAGDKSMEQSSDDGEDNSNSTLDVSNSGVPSPRDQDLASRDDTADPTAKKSSICSLCLNAYHDETEVIQCDNCGLTVHEGCYGVGDDSSESSEGSSETTEPWFCEPCLAGLKPDDLHCELCPSKGGAMKRADYGGRWVHLLCALYTSGCSFGDLEQLSPVCIFDVGYNRFGSKSCAGCQKHGNRLAARTGISSKCDAGMCKIYYHITCAQRSGLLVCSSLMNSSMDSSGGEHSVADPYFFCCPAHSDRHAMQVKIKRYQTLERQKLTNQQRELTPREQDVFEKRRGSYALAVAAKRPGWMPSNEKWQRLLPTSSEFFEKMGQKAEAVEGITRQEWEGEFRVSFSADMVGKFVMPPAFSSDFVSYFSERDKLFPKLRSRIEELTGQNNKLRVAQEELKLTVDKMDQEKRKAEYSLNETHENLSTICVNLKQLGCKTTQPPAPLAILTPSPINGINDPPSKKSLIAASKPAGINGLIKRQLDKQRSLGSTSSLTSTSTGRKAVGDDSSVDIVRIRQCAECEHSHDQHLMAHCDTCKNHYHISCLDPPLTKLPKKTSLFGWECSKCCESSTDSSDVEVDTSAPRQLRMKRKPVVRFTAEELNDAVLMDAMDTNGFSQSGRSLSKKRTSNDTHKTPVMFRQRGNTPRSEDKSSTKKNVFSPDTDHSSMARGENQKSMEANIEKSVNAVLKRAGFSPRRSPTKTFRLKSESVTDVGLEDEKDESSGASLESTEHFGTAKRRRVSTGHDSLASAAKRRGATSTAKRREDFVIRVEDLE